MIVRTLYLCIAFLILGCSNHSTKNNTNAGEGSLPNIDLLLIDSSARTVKSFLFKGDAIIFVYFEPDCPHCHDITKHVLQNITPSDNIKVFFLSNYPLNWITKFCNHFQTNKFSNIIVGQDYQNDFSKHFKPMGVPFIAIYGRDKKLKKVHAGEMDIKDMRSSALN